MRKIIIFASVLLFASVSTQVSAQITSPSPYCDGSFDDGAPNPFPVADQVKAVSLGTLSNTSNAQTPAPHYIYYNNLAQANFTKGSSYNLSVTFEVHGNAGYGVWIDYNHDNQFSPSEKVSGTDTTTALNISNNTVITGNVIIPASAQTGKTRMRVRIVEDDNYTMNIGTAILPCNASASNTDVMDWGETEDYDVFINNSTAGIQNNRTLTEISVYPNPVKTVLNISAVSTKNLSYKIYDITGKIIKQGALLKQSVDVSKLTNGLYFIRILDENNLLGQYKFVKE